MKTEGRRESSNVEDRRGVRFRGLPAAGRGIGLGTIVLVLVGMYFGVDPRVILQLAGSRGPPELSQETPAGRPPAGDPLARFVSVVLADTEDAWRPLFQRAGATYREPKLVLFSDAVSSACGFAQSAMGPFYCPLDEAVYIDLSFYRDLKERFRAPGDFAQAYVVAHEVGHHVQNLLGISEEVRRAQQSVGRAEANQLSVRVELQADCLAGVWANHAQRARDILEEGDVEEALGAATAIGDDRLQARTGGQVVPESFTHGSSTQRVRWFRRGLELGELEQCNTFKAAKL
ncbi:MAG: KPN_02809 family neutral zinc metallopeptidase [Gammaproteobacteria bacterium]